MHNVLRIIIWVLAIAGIGVVLGFASKSNNLLTFKKPTVSIDYETENRFVDEQDILNQVLSRGDTGMLYICLLYTSPSPRDRSLSRMPSSA